MSTGNVQALSGNKESLATPKNLALVGFVLVAGAISIFTAGYFGDITSIPIGVTYGIAAGYGFVGMGLWIEAVIKRVKKKKIEDMYNEAKHLIDKTEEELLLLSKVVRNMVDEVNDNVKSQNYDYLRKSLELSENRNSWSDNQFVLCSELEGIKNAKNISEAQKLFKAIEKQCLVYLFTTISDAPETFFDDLKKQKINATPDESEFISQILGEANEAFNKLKTGQQETFTIYQQLKEIVNTMSEQIQQMKREQASFDDLNRLETDIKEVKEKLKEITQKGDLHSDMMVSSKHNSFSSYALMNSWYQQIEVLENKLKCMEDAFASENRTHDAKYGEEAFATHTELFKSVRTFREQFELLQAKEEQNDGYAKEVREKLRLLITTNPAYVESVKAALNNPQKSNDALREE